MLSRMIRGSTVWPSSRVLRTSLPEMNTGFLVFSFISLYMLMQFARAFLDLPRTHRLLDRAFQAGIVANLAGLAALVFLPVGHLYAFTQLVAVAVALLLWGAARGLCLLLAACRSSLVASRFKSKSVSAFRPSHFSLNGQREVTKRNPPRVRAPCASCTRGSLRCSPDQGRCATRGFSPSA